MSITGPYPITTSLRVLKELQYIKEQVKGITPDSPVFTAIGVNEFLPITASRIIKYTKLGNVDITKAIPNTMRHDFSMLYSPVSLDALLQSMVNMTGTNNREDSYTFLLSQQHPNDDSTALEEKYQIARGCTIASLTIRASERRLVSIRARWAALSITDWSAEHGLTGSPTFDTLSADSIPWSSIDTGNNPLKFLDLGGPGQEYDIRNIIIVINHNILRRQIFDQDYSVRIDPTIRDITINFDIVYKDNEISETVKTFQQQQLTLQLNRTTAAIIDRIILTFEGVLLHTYEEVVNANERRRIKTVHYTGTANSVSIAMETSGGYVTASLVQKYHMGGKVIETSIQKHYILNTVPALTSIHKYAIRQAAIQTSIHKYNAIGVVTATSTQKYDIQPLGLGNFEDENFESSNFVLD